MHPKDISITAFTYELPGERIARYPLPGRDDSKLLVFDQGSICEDTYARLDQHLPSDSFLLFNNSRVIEARLLFQKSTGTEVEIFCLEPYHSNVSAAMQQQGTVEWRCMVGGAKKWKEDILSKSIPTDTGTVHLTAKKIKQENGTWIISFRWSPAELPFAAVLHLSGVLPLPPYLNRAAEKKDSDTYQTVYATSEGSVAAPTAGLHFTWELLQKLEQKGIGKAFITLHVGAGTFLPVKAETMKGHTMHAEFIDLSVGAIEAIRGNIGKPIVCVGTTSLRATESLYWMGVKLSKALAEDPSAAISAEDIAVQQWDPYEIRGSLTAAGSLDILLGWMKKTLATRLVVKTQILIAPGYRCRIAKGLITNFHQPQSTLLLLVAAVAGPQWRSIYEYALQHDFRFLSYGDGSLLWLAKE